MAYSKTTWIDTVTPANATNLNKIEVGIETVSLGVPINVREYGALGDGSTNDYTAFFNALSAASTAGAALLVPRGTYVISSATRLVITGNFTSIIGDPSGGTLIKFTNAAGGLDIGDGTNNIYQNRLAHVRFSGNSTATTLIRLRKAYESNIQRVFLDAAVTTLLDMTDSGSQLGAEWLSLANCATGIKISGTVSPVMDIRQLNAYNLTTEVIRISGTQIGRLHLSDGWIEACNAIITLNNAGNAISIGEIIGRDIHTFNSGSTFRVLYAVATSGVNSERVEFTGCYFDAQSATQPLIDFTAVDNSTATWWCSLKESVVKTGNTGALIQAHASQAWYLFHTDVQEIAGVTADKWSGTAAVTGGTYPVPPRLTGSGSPNSAVAAPVGSTFVRIDGGASTTFYVKESGTGNTGWVAK